MIELHEQLNTKLLNTQLLDDIADMVRIMDQDNRVIFFNRSMTETFDGEVEKLLCPVDEEEEGICNLSISARTLQTGEVISREEKIADGYYSVKTSPIRGKSGEIIGTIEVFRNKTMEKKLQQELIRRNKQMVREMNSARSIQQGLLPNKGSYGDLTMDYLYLPAEKLSGDIFDLFPIGKHQYGVYIADAVGHGFASSMSTMFIFQALKNMRRETQRDPSFALKEISRRFQALGLNMDIYFTIFYGVLDLKKETFLFANGGHNCPALLMNEKDSEQISLEVRGFPISRLFEVQDYETKKVDFKRGSRLLLMSDGVLESFNRKREQFGLNRVKELLQRDKDQFLTNLQNEIEAFTQGEVSDDMTADRKSVV